MTRKQEYKERQKEGRDPQAWFVNDPTAQGGVRVANKKGEKAAFPVKFQQEKP